VAQVVAVDHVGANAHSGPDEIRLHLENADAESTGSGVALVHGLHGALGKLLRGFTGEIGGGHGALCAHRQVARKSHRIMDL
jgi:hypothetical protein